MKSALPYRQDPGVCVPLEAPTSVTVTPVAVDTSAVVTRVHASTVVYNFDLAAGEGLTEAFEDGLDDPQAITKRPNVAITAIKPLAEMVLAAWLARLTLGP